MTYAQGSGQEGGGGFAPVGAGFPAGPTVPGVPSVPSFPSEPGSPGGPGGPTWHEQPKNSKSGHLIRLLSYEQWTYSRRRRRQYHCHSRLYTVTAEELVSMVLARDTEPVLPREEVARRGLSEVAAECVRAMPDWELRMDMMRTLVLSVPAPADWLQQPELPRLPGLLGLLQELELSPNLQELRAVAPPTEALGHLPGIRQSVLLSLKQAPRGQ